MRTIDQDRQIGPVEVKSIVNYETGVHHAVKDNGDERDTYMSLCGRYEDDRLINGVNIGIIGCETCCEHIDNEYHLTNTQRLVSQIKGDKGYDLNMYVEQIASKRELLRWIDSQLEVYNIHLSSHDDSVDMPYYSPGPMQILIGERNKLFELKVKLLGADEVFEEDENG